MPPFPRLLDSLGSSDKSYERKIKIIMLQSQLQSIVEKFAVSATVSTIRPLGSGLINDTYLVVTEEKDQPDYVLQRINHEVFPDVDMVMRNIAIVTRHIRERLIAQGETDLRHHVLEFLPTVEDANRLYAEVDGHYWRLMVFIDHAVTKQEVNPENAHAAGQSFGHFQAMLADVPCQLGETIKDFHNMEFRIEQLKQACVEDRAGRFDEPAVQELLEQLGNRAEAMTEAERLGREGKLPKRVCHCDTKVNNMLFSEDGSEVLCVIDLDTVMPSFIFSDYGDFLRTAASTAAEDEPDFSKIQFRQDVFQAFTKGYLASARSFLTPLEIQMLPYAVVLFPYMQSVRFLWDYLNGDGYWKVQYPTHNLVRAQNQFELVKRVEEAMPAIKAFINSQLN